MPERSSSRAASLELWRRFTRAFAAGVRETEVPALAESWANERRRTAFYSNVLLPRVARSLGMTMESEVFRRTDFAFFKDGGVPEVMIESENKAFGSSTEIHQLCALSAPLRVLLTVTEWDDRPGAWPHGGLKGQYLNEWRAIIRRYSAVWPRHGVLGALVGERRGDTLTFFSVAFEHDGSLIDDGSLLAEVHVGVGGALPPLTA